MIRSETPQGYSALLFDRAVFGIDLKGNWIGNLKSHFLSIFEPVIELLSMVSVHTHTPKWVHLS